MKLALKPVCAIESRGEVLFSRKRRRKGSTFSDAEFGVFRVAKMPPPCSEAKTLEQLFHDLGLPERAAAKALGTTVSLLHGLFKGEVAPEQADGWALATQAFQEAAVHLRVAPPERW